MKYKAIKSFAGAVSMALGEIREIDDDEIVNDLLESKYIVKVGDKNGSDSKRKRNNA